MVKRGVITFAAAPGDGEVSAIVGDGFGEADGCFTLPTRSDEASAQKGFLCAQDCAFNLHAARRVTGNDKRFLESPKALGQAKPQSQNIAAERFSGLGRFKKSLIVTRN